MKMGTAQTKYLSDVSFTTILVTFWNPRGYLCNRHFAKCQSGKGIESKVDLIS